MPKQKKKPNSKTPAIAIIMGSQNDLPIMQGAQETLNELGIPFRTHIVSAHRTPEWMVEFAKSAHKENIQVIIAGAGGAAHLPGMVASLTPLPVIGVPIEVGILKGLDALLSIWQMPKGVPVATVAINNAQNAALLAIRMLGIHDKKMQKLIVAKQAKEAKNVLAQNKQLAPAKRKK